MQVKDVEIFQGSAFQYSKAPKSYLIGLLSFDIL